MSAATATHLISFDADGDRASQRRQAVQGKDSDGNFAGTRRIFTKVQTIINPSYG